MTRGDQVNLDIHAAPKAATIVLIAKVQPVLFEIGEGFFVFRFPRTPKTEVALQAFFDNVPLPVKTFSDLSRSLQGQLMSLKKV